MKNANIGIANLIISNKLKESYFNQNLIEESKKLAFDFLDIVKNSPILQLEFKVFNNIENKHIDSDLTATRYIDNNIKLFEIYTIKEIDAEREKLKSFIGEALIPIDNKKVMLYHAIDNLIRETLNNPDDVNVDIIHESFTIVLNHIKENKKVIVESVENKQVNEEIIEIAVDKFNQKYDTLNEDDKNLLQKLIKSNVEQKKELLESYKNENLIILESVNKDSIKTSITTAISKINEMSFNPEKVDDDIISLHELKISLSKKN
jgi:hypothetical protein